MKNQRQKLEKNQTREQNPFSEGVRARDALNLNFKAIFFFLIVFWGQVGAEPLKNIKAVKKECRTSSTVSVGGRTFQAAYSDARRVAHANNYTVKMQKTVQLMDGSYVSVVEVNKKSILNKKLINE